MKIHYFGHSAVLVEAGENRYLIDPFLRGNPLSPVDPKDIKCNYIILTHGHEDHLGDTVEIAKNNNATVIGVWELAQYCGSQGVNVYPMQLGGKFKIGQDEIQLTIAHHSSSIGVGEGKFLYLGNPAGVLIKSNGKTLYHAGDTALFLDMKLIGELNKIDIALLPVGGTFTMDMYDAAIAGEFLRVKKIMPIHHNTFPPIMIDMEEFENVIRSKSIEPIVVNPGGVFEI